MARADALKKFIKYLEDAINERPVVKDPMAVRMEYPVNSLDRVAQHNDGYPTASYRATQSDKEDVQALELFGAPQERIDAYRQQLAATPNTIEYEALMEATRRYLADQNEPLNRTAAANTEQLAREISRGEDLSNAPPQRFYGIDIPYLKQLLPQYNFDQDSVDLRLEDMGYQTYGASRDRPEFTSRDGDSLYPWYRSVSSDNADPRAPGTTRRMMQLASEGVPVPVFAADNPDVARSYVKHKFSDLLLDRDTPFSTAYGITDNDLDFKELSGFDTIVNYGRPIDTIPAYTLPIAPARRRVVYDDFDEFEQRNMPGSTWSELVDRALRMNGDDTRVQLPPRYYGLPEETTPEEVAQYLAGDVRDRRINTTNDLLRKVREFTQSEYGATMPVEFQRIMDLGGMPRYQRMADPTDPDGLMTHGYAGSNILAGDVTNMRSPLGLALPQLKGAPWLMGAAAGAAYGLPYLMESTDEQY